MDGTMAPVCRLASMRPGAIRRDQCPDVRAGPPQSSCFNVARRDSPGSAGARRAGLCKPHSASMRPGANRRDQTRTIVSQPVKPFFELQCGPGAIRRDRCGHFPVRRFLSSSLSMRPGAIRRDQIAIPAATTLILHGFNAARRDSPGSTDTLWPRIITPPTRLQCGPACSPGSTSLCAAYARARASFNAARRERRDQRELERFVTALP